MTKDEALKLALEALESIEWHGAGSCWVLDDEKVESAEAALREAVAQPEEQQSCDKQEPAAWITPDGEGFRIRFSPPTSDVPLGWDALYTASPQRPWVGLTEQDIDIAFDDTQEGGGFDDFARAIEAKLKAVNGFLKEKNT